VGLAEDLVDAFNAAAGGPHHGVRAAHAKGVVCEGEFTATPEAARITRAPHMQGDPVRATVRFSNGTGNPATHDGQRDGRGMAVKLYLPDDSRTDIVCVSLPSFFARIPEDLLEFTRLRTPDPATGEVDMEAMGTYLAAHPEALPAIQGAIGKGPPASYAQWTYNSLHAFALVDAAGRRRFARYRWQPAAGEDELDDADALARPPDYLTHELRERLAHQLVVFDLVLRLADPGDDVNDATVAWPEGEREEVVAGRLEVEALCETRERDGDVLVFDPSRVTDGIELSDDPILHARPGAYSVSVARRTAAAAGPFTP
jgi:catalase